jgi:hypothetical protein
LSDALRDLLARPVSHLLPVRGESTAYRLAKRLISDAIFRADNEAANMVCNRVEGTPYSQIELLRAEQLQLDAANDPKTNGRARDIKLIVDKLFPKNSDTIDVTPQLPPVPKKDVN